jgi:hypothetical protein
MSPANDVEVLERLFGKMQHDLWQLRSDLAQLRINNADIEAAIIQQRDILEQECESLFRTITNMRPRHEP